MLYKKIFTLKKSFKIISGVFFSYLAWFNDILVGRKSKIFIKTFLYFTLPVLLLLKFGFLDKFLQNERLASYSIVYKEPKSFFNNYVKLDISKFKGKDELNKFINKLSENKPKLIVLDFIGDIDIPNNVRFIKTVNLPIGISNSPKSLEFTENFDSIKKVSFPLKNAVSENVSLSLDKRIYAGGFLLVKDGLDFKYYIKTKNRFYYSLPMAIVKGLESWDSTYIKNDLLIFHKLKDNKTRTLNIDPGTQFLNPFHDFTKIRELGNDLSSVRGKVVIVSDNKNKNINLSSFTRISRADYIILASQGIYKNDTLPKISKPLIAFILILLLSIVSILNLFYKKRHRSLIFISLFAFYIILAFFFIKVAQLYLGFIPIVVPYVFAYFYGVFFTNRDDVSMSKGKRDLALIGIDFIDLDKSLNELDNEDEVNDLYSIINIIRQKLLNLSSANAVVESFDYSNKVFFLLEKDNLLYKNFWESLENFIRSLEKFSKTYKNLAIPRIIGVEGSFYFYPEDNFWTGSGKDIFYKVRKHTKDQIVFDINIIPNGYMNTQYKEVKVGLSKFYGRSI